MTWPWQLVSVPILIALNAFFVAAEYVVVSLRPTQIQILRQRGHVLAGNAAARLKADIPSAIGAIQVCITMTNLMLGWLGEPAMTRLLGVLFGPLAMFMPEEIFIAISTVVSFLIVTLLTVVLSELVPKALTLQHAQAIAVFTAVPMLMVMRAIRPLVWVMNTTASAVTRLMGLGPVKIEGEVHTPDEIMAIAIESANAGELTPRQRPLVLNALRLGRKKAKEVMVPRVRVACLDIKQSMEQNFRVADASLFSRLPLVNGGLDRVMGVVSTREFLTAFHAGADSSMLPLLSEEPVFVPETASLDKLLAAFHESGVRMVFLVDEYGGVEGIATLADVFKELMHGRGADDAQDFR